jgi:phosphopantetheine--protein transferase-like protein
MKRSIPLGVDILEWKKAKAFYEKHSRRLGSWLTSEERLFVEKKDKPHEAFAMIFAAREAAFKALGRECRVVPVSSTRFAVRDRSKLRVTVSRHRRHVVACAYKP